MATPADRQTNGVVSAEGRETTVAFRTLGCKLNQCETAQMQETLLAQGYRLVDWASAADVRVVNTCTVTAKSDRSCRHEIRLAKRRDPSSTMVVTGCYAQIDPEAVAAIPGVDLVLGNLDKSRLAQHLAEIAAPAVVTATPERRPTLSVSPYPEHPEFEGEFFSQFYGYTRAFLKVQNGCDSYCAYCIIPIARGPARSMRVADVLREVELLAVRGFREVVLTGINLGSWGRDTGEGTVADLLEALLGGRHDHAGAPRARVDRYRLSSIEPLEVDGALMAVIEAAGDRVARHFHLPLQSGSDAVLRRMSRPYTAARYLEVVTELAERFPDAAIGADVIVGFPGETDAEFAETVAFVEAAPLTYLHVFSYSDRPGTRASQVEPKVAAEIIHDRSVRLRTLGEHKKDVFRDRLRGTRQRVLVLKERLSNDVSAANGEAAAGRLVGITGNYLEVLLDGGDELMNRFVEVRLTGPGEEGRWEATVVSVEPAERTTERPPAGGGAIGRASGGAGEDTGLGEPS